MQRVSSGWPAKSGRRRPRKDQTIVTQLVSRSACCGGGRRSQRRSLVLVEEARIDSHDLLDLLPYFHAESEQLEQVAQSVAVDQLDGRSTVPGCFCLGVTGERSRRDQQPFLTPASHRAAEVSHDPRGDGPLVSLALEVHRERHQRQTVGARAIYATIAALARYGDVDKSRFAEDALGQSLEPIGRQLQQPSDELILPLAFCFCLFLASAPAA